MAYNQSQSAPFWDFIRSFDGGNNGAGVDHPAPDFSFFGVEGPHGSYAPPPHPTGVPFGGGAFFGPFGPERGFGGPNACGRGGRRGRHCHRREGPREPSGSQSPHGERSEGEAREGLSDGPWGPRRGGFGRHGRGGHGRRGPPPFSRPEGANLPFDMNALVDAFASHPFAQALRGFAEQAGAGAEAQRSGETLVPEDADSENSFTPPIDVFSTEREYVLHVALPGAKKEDVGVNWDAEKGVLNVAGVVYRQGDEEFLKTLSKSERKVGVFERTIKLPPGTEEKEEVDGDSITAKLEDGVLVVSVPKVEKEWTEVKKVDIE